MKIITWNCNLNFAKKFEHLEPMDADIFIIQECEKLKEDYFPNSQFYWTGRIEKKGLGVLIKNNSASLDPIHNPKLINFLPIRSDNFKLLGVWAYNHRAKKFGDHVSGRTIQAIEYYKEWLGNESMPCIFGGDFNNSVIWDKPNNENNFENINKKLEDLGFRSAYHLKTNDAYGSEKTATFFHTKKESKKYHIDYLYLKSLEFKSIEVGKFKDWIKLSDHVPVLVELSIL
jgi:exonuclease III